MYKYLLILLLLTGCGGDKKPTPIPEPEYELVFDSLSLSESIGSSIYWAIPQYYGPNEDIPKYTASGTYTNKHIPMAYWANGSLFHLYSDNTQDDNFYLYAVKGSDPETAEKVLVHTIENWNDPHTNGAIVVLPDGTVRVQVASRGLNHKFQSGKIYESQTPYELDFVCVDGCDNINFEAYPQVWNTAWGLHIGYTYYTKDTDYHPTYNLRELWYRVGDTRTQLVKGGHYAISVYEEGTLTLVYNSHDNGTPDERRNLYLMQTTDGVNWTNLAGESLTFPLEPFDPITLIYESYEFAYLKDIQNGKILFTESPSKDPTEGTRSLKEWSVDGVRTIVEAHGHNYNGGAYFGDYIIATQDSPAPVYGWEGGQIVVYDSEATEVFRHYELNCNYPRKAVGNPNTGVVSCGSAHIEEPGRHHVIHMNYVERLVQ